MTTVKNALRKGSRYSAFSHCGRGHNTVFQLDLKWQTAGSYSETQLTRKVPRHRPDNYGNCLGAKTPTA